MIAQILWDLAGVICLAFSPLLQQWLFDYGLQSPLKKIVMANMFPNREMILQRKSKIIWNLLSISYAA